MVSILIQNLILIVLERREVKHNNDSKTKSKLTENSSPIPIEMYASVSYLSSI